MTAEQVTKVEDLVNAEVLANRDSKTDVLSIAEAKKRGAVAMFGEKYGETVRVVQIGGESLEFCGGTHVARAGDIGLFKITSESGIAQGVRRIEAVTAMGALAQFRRMEHELAELGARLKVSPLQVAEKVEKLQGELKKADREIAQLKAKLAGGGSKDLLSGLVDVDGVKVLAASTEVDDVKTLRETGDRIRDKLGSGIVVLAGVGDGKVSLVAMVTKDLTQRFHAGKLLEVVAEATGGKAGGRPDMAQGGGKDPGKVREGLDRVLRPRGDSEDPGLNGLSQEYRHTEGGRLASTPWSKATCAHWQSAHRVPAVRLLVLSIR
jgi:alanyl-tRNA synthetase